ncbi:MAG: hypothetical protein RBG13Loki_3646 [Promethearchaeota archaeon CR_4]|nr:MAG: hypothetical protein RBG13Loki_3646 [Candidatus Lokiarchaeota archaeon CR_4]
MLRLMKHLGVTGVQDIHEFRRFSEIAISIFYPWPDFDYHFEQLSDSTLVAIVRWCAICENVKRGGVAKFYECGCIAMLSGWYEALGVDTEVTVDKSLKTGDDKCEFYFHVKSWEYSNREKPIIREDLD